jgi:hypothetical protein
MYSFFAFCGVIMYEQARRMKDIQENCSTRVQNVLLPYNVHFFDT